MKSPAWLKNLLGDKLALDALQKAAAAEPMTLAKIEAQFKLYSKQEDIEIRQFGYSTNGYPIKGIVLGRETAKKTALIYAYPHPEEPLGANVCFELVKFFQQSKGYLNQQWRLIILPCADPDMTALNQSWIEGETLMDFVVGSFRPMQIEREVDYGFPIDHPKIYQADDTDGAKECYYAGKCVQEEVCGPVCSRYLDSCGPLAESLIIANIIRRELPDIVIALHNSAIGGSYDFLSWKPGRKFVNALDFIAKTTGHPRHLGEKIDVAKSHIKSRPDILVEPLLEDDLKELEKYHGELQPGETFAGNVSMAQFVESLDADIKIFMPEAMHFSSPKFADLTPTLLTRVVRVDGVHALSHFELPNGHKMEVNYGSKLAKKLKSGEHEITMTQGMLGVEMVAMRHWINHELQEAWDNLPKEVKEFDHPIAAELRCGIPKPGYSRHTDDDEYKKEIIQATVSDEAVFLYRFKLILAARVGLLQRLIVLTNADALETFTRLQTLIEQLLSNFPKELQTTNQRQPGIHSQLLRTLLALSEIE